jgi:hypothetical protein
VLRGLAVCGVIAVSLGGCAYARLQHPTTAMVATCGTVPIVPWLAYDEALGRAAEEVQCIRTLEGQGYTYIPAWDYPFLRGQQPNPWN